MRGWFGKTKERGARFCERCSRVCDAGCRREALRERALMQHVWLGMRV